MSGKFTIALATAATVAVASLATSSATYARGGFGSGGMHASFARSSGFRHVSASRMLRTSTNNALVPILGPRRPPISWHHHDHHHWVFRGGRWIIEDVAAVETPIVLPQASTPAPCTCLTKTYTPTGLVVFADVCTKESASAPALDDTADASQAPTSPVAATATPIAQVPTTPNYAGQTYQQYLAANPQAAQPQAAAQPAPTPPAPQQN